MSHRFCSRKAENVGDSRARSQVEKHPITCNHPPAAFDKAYLNGFRSHKLGFTLNEFCSGSLEPVEMKLNLALHHLLLASQDALHICRNRSALDAIFRSVPREPVRLCAANYVLAG